MMIRNAIVFAGLWGLLSGAASAAGGCGCPVIPMEGTYAAGATTMDVRHVVSEGGACPSALAISGTRVGAPPVDVMLICQAGVWQGFEPFPGGGAFNWMISGQFPGPGAGPTVGVRGAESITVKLGLPKMMHTMSKTDREFVLDLVGAARAPDCLCKRVREEHEFAERMIDAYSDPVKIAAANDFALRGLDQRAHHYLDANSRLVEFGQASKIPYSFDDFVKLNQMGEAAIIGGAISIESGSKSTSDIIAANGVPESGVQPGAEASTHPRSCLVSMPPPEEAVTFCTPAVVLNAWWMHEESHAARCRAINAAPVYLADGKTSVNLNDGMTMSDGLVLPASPYYAWLQAPENQAANEAEGYRVEKAVYDTWLGKYCGD